MARVMDHIGRSFQVLRVSLLDRCNFACTYCVCESCLTSRQVLTTALLSQCRFAVDDTFVGEDYLVQQGDVVLVVPPSSGG